MNGIESPYSNIFESLVESSHSFWQPHIESIQKKFSRLHVLSLQTLECTSPSLSGSWPKNCMSTSSFHSTVSLQYCARSANKASLTFSSRQSQKYECMSSIYGNMSCLFTKVCIFLFTQPVWRLDRRWTSGRGGTIVRKRRTRAHVQMHPTSDLWKPLI